MSDVTFFTERIAVIWNSLPLSIVDFSERELKFMFAICHRASVCLSVCLSVVCNVRAPYSDD